MFVLGLTGSIGMGKSTTAGFFAETGVPVYDADAAVHALYEGEAVAPIEAAFPGSTRDGKVDREELARRVLGDPQALERLEATPAWSNLSASSAITRWSP
jgi:dephospho-CoA kinase